MVDKIIGDLLNLYDLVSLFTGNLYRKYEETKRIDLENLHLMEGKSMSHNEFCRKYTTELFASFQSHSFGVFLVSEIWNLQSSEYNMNSKTIVEDTVTLSLEDFFPSEYNFIQLPNEENDSKVYIYAFNADETMVLKILDFYFNSFAPNENDCLRYELEILDFNSNTLVRFELDEVIDLLELDFNVGRKKYLSAYFDDVKVFTPKTNSKVLIEKVKLT